ncbi:DUF2231 domain-containing protein [Microbacterium sp.]|uniref:DUF2231 domain-containing protein n=1 Tax=Microbacterium sp. TaxID=51671 RepID=UPI002733C90E|nr:DUF2231 domain-containing protein [Microbacterium sp.]MDP3949472.1 hypothetical protein [Microbacterium sp.]
MNSLTVTGAFEIGGLPLHPLIVHLVVVLTPLTALALMLSVFWPAARRRLGIVTPLAALFVLILVPITVAAGESLKEVVGPLPAVERHESWGRMLLPWAIALFVVAAAQWAWYRFGRPGAVEERPPLARVTGVALGVLAIGVSIGTIVMIVLIGDSGARAVWGS